MGHWYFVPNGCTALASSSTYLSDGHPISGFSLLIGTFYPFGPGGQGYAASYSGGTLWKDPNGVAPSRDWLDWLVKNYLRATPFDHALGQAIYRLAIACGVSNETLANMSPWTLLTLTTVAATAATLVGGPGVINFINESKCAYNTAWYIRCKVLNGNCFDAGTTVLIASAAGSPGAEPPLPLTGEGEDRMRLLSGSVLLVGIAGWQIGERQARRGRKRHRSAADLVFADLWEGAGLDDGDEIGGPLAESEYGNRDLADAFAESVPRWCRRRTPHRRSPLALPCSRPRSPSPPRPIDCGVGPR